MFKYKTLEDLLSGTDSDGDVKLICTADGNEQVVGLVHSQFLSFSSAVLANALSCRPAVVSGEKQPPFKFELKVDGSVDAWRCILQRLYPFYPQPSNNLSVVATMLPVLHKYDIAHLLTSALDFVNSNLIRPPSSLSPDPFSPSYVLKWLNLADGLQLDDIKTACLSKMRQMSVARTLEKALVVIPSATAVTTPPKPMSCPGPPVPPVPSSQCSCIGPRTCQPCNSKQPTPSLYDRREVRERRSEPPPASGACFPPAAPAPAPAAPVVVDSAHAGGACQKYCLKCKIWTCSPTKPKSAFGVFQPVICHTCGSVLKVPSSAAEGLIRATWRRDSKPRVTQAVKDMSREEIEDLLAMLVATNSPDYEDSDAPPAGPLFVVAPLVGPALPVAPAPAAQIFGAQAGQAAGPAF